MLRVGLTGGIGCGKSTVAMMMRELGCHIIDADKIAHAVIAPGGPAHEEIRRRFGVNVVAPDGSIDRARLAAVVFADANELASLNAIVHPRVLRAVDREFERISQSDPRGVAAVEAALLIESGYHQGLDRLVLVTCTAAQQLQRLTSPAFGRAMSRVQAEQRIAAQMTADQKRQLAAGKLDEIDCSGSLDYTKNQVREIMDRFKRMADSAAR